MFRELVRPLLHPLFIKVGSSRVIIVNEQKKILVDEPALIAVSKATGEVIALGEDARILMKMTSDDIEISSLFIRGELVDERLLTAYLRQLFGRVSHSLFHLFFPYPVIFLEPIRFAKSQRDLVREALLQSHFLPIAFIPQIRGDSRQLLGETKAQTFCTIRVGGSLTQVVLTVGAHHIFESRMPSGGQDIDTMIRASVYERYGLLISPYSLRSIKEEYTKALSSGYTFSFVVRGRQVHEGTITSIQLTEEDIHQVCELFFRELITTVKYELRDYLEILSDPSAHVGCLLSGGCSHLPELSNEVLRQLGITPELVSRPHVASALGVAHMYQRNEL